MATDAETGEWNQATTTTTMQGFDQETGEMFDYSYLASTTTTNPPQLLAAELLRAAVPEAYIRQQQQEEAHATTLTTGQRCRVKRKSFITLGYNPTHKLFLIPSLFFFFRITALVLLFCELILHIWAHRKNSRNPNQDTFYRSPLHLITGQFCAKCTSDVGMMKLGKIQDRRREAKRLMGGYSSVAAVVA